MRKENRLELANLAQQPGWTIDSLLDAAAGWIGLSEITRQKSLKHIGYMYLNRAMEIEAGLTISGK